MPAATAPVSGGLVRVALDYAVEHQYSVLLEGTFRDPVMVIGTASRFAEAGYTVEVVAVATPAPVSRLGAEQRFLGAPSPRAARWTPPEAHEAALTGSPEVVAALEASPVVSRIQIHSRERQLYENVRAADGVWRHEATGADALHAEQDRQLTPVEARAWLERYATVFDAAQRRLGYLGPRTAPAYLLLQEDAATLISTAATDPQADAIALRHLHAQRTRRIIALSSAGSTTLLSADVDSGCGASGGSDSQQGRAAQGGKQQQDRHQ